MRSAIEKPSEPCRRKRLEASERMRLRVSSLCSWEYRIGCQYGIIYIISCRRVNSKAAKRPPPNRRFCWDANLGKNAALGYVVKVLG
jgi:hypothetical protein